MGYTDEARKHWRDEDDGTTWEVLGVVGESDTLDCEGGYFYSSRPYPELGHGTVDDGPRMRVRREQTSDEKADSARHAESYGRYMDAADDSWRSLCEAISRRLPGDLKATVWQTGGMCLAIGWKLDEDSEAHAMLTDEHGPIRQLREETGHWKDRETGEETRKQLKPMLGVYLDEAMSMCGEGKWANLDGFALADSNRDDELAEQLVKLTGEWAAELRSSSPASA